MPDSTIDLTEASDAARGDDGQDDKAMLRRRVRATRRARTPAEQRELAHRLRDTLLGVPALSRARCVAVYVSMPGEPGTGPLRATLRAGGVRVLLPVMRPGGDLDWARDDGRTRAAGAGRGGPVPLGPPLGPDALAQAEVVVVPALAVDTLGHRLGQGAGCYDRSLHRADPAALLVAAVHEDEVLDAAVEQVPALSHDVAVHAVLTPLRWMPLDLALT